MCNNNIGFRKWPLVRRIFYLSSICRKLRRVFCVKKEKKAASQQIYLTMFLFQIVSSRYFYSSTKISTHLIAKSRERNGEKNGSCCESRTFAEWLHQKIQGHPIWVFYLPRRDYVFKLLSWIWKLSRNWENFYFYGSSTHLVPVTLCLCYGMKKVWHAKWEMGPSLPLYSSTDCIIMQVMMF